VSDKAARVATAIVVYALATALSVAVFHGRSAGLFIDGALLLGLFYYLSTTRD
jgi:hypothetical protein